MLMEHDTTMDCAKVPGPGSCAKLGCTYWWHDRQQNVTSNAEIRKGQLGCKQDLDQMHISTQQKQNQRTHRQHRPRIIHVALPILVSALTCPDDITFQCIYCFLIKVIKVCALQCFLGLQSVRSLSVICQTLYQMGTGHALHMLLA